MKPHVILDLPPEYPGGKPGRRCCVCQIPESICLDHPKCRGGKNICPYTRADGKTADRARKRERLKRRTR